MVEHDYSLLDPAEEAALHNNRLLSVEEKPFKRLTGRLLKSDSLILVQPSSLPTPPPETTAVDEAAALEEKKAKQSEQRNTWRQDVLMDFAAFESSLMRMQLVHHSNQKERERYAAEKVKILDTAQEIRDSTADLRVQLEEAQNTLALRKSYDELAEKITSNRMLRPREDQHVQLEKLNAEIAELEEESREYARTWAERREQFGRIVEEGRQMLRLIRDEKEEAERKEGMEGAEDAEDADGSTVRGETSRMGTPRPDMGGTTPLHGGQTSDGDGTDPSRLTVQHNRPSHSASPGILANGVGSRIGSPRPESTRGSGVDAQDMEMRESGDTHDDESEMEEGEEEDDGEPVDKMDVN